MSLPARERELVTTHRSVSDLGEALIDGVRLEWFITGKQSIQKNIYT